MKRLLSILLAVLFLASACGNDAAAPVKVVTTTPPKGGRSASSAVSNLQETVDGGLLARFAEDLADSGFSLRADSPETAGQPYKRINTADDFGPQAARLLTENAARAIQTEKTGDRALTLSAENGEALDTARFYAPDSGDPDYADQMILVLDLAGQTGAYAFDQTVYTNLEALFKERTEGVNTEFQGNASLLTSKYDLARLRDDKGYDIHEFLQFGNRILWRFTPGTDGYVKPSTLELLDIPTGKSVYTASVSENVARMEKFDGEAGFNYRLITPTGIIYRSSADRSREKLWRLPGIVSLFSASEELSGSFDMQHGKLAYASDDGVYLADEDGGNAQPLLFHSALTEVMKPAAAAGYTYYFTDPRFLLGGKRLATSIVSPQTGRRRLGFAVTDLDTMETSYFTGATAAGGDGVRYLSDKVLIAQDAGVITLINAENGDRGALPLNGLEGSRFLTWDCKSFAVWEPKVTGTDAHSSVMYLSNNENINDLSRKLLSTYGGEYTPVGMTEEYVMGLNEDSRGLSLTATRYQTVRRQQVRPESNPEPESSSSASSGAGEEDDGGTEGGLPPDITPDL